MKIYNEVVIDMNTGETIYEDSFEYEGDMALLYGGEEDDGITSGTGNIADDPSANKNQDISMVGRDWGLESLSMDQFYTVVNGKKVPKTENEILNLILQHKPYNKDAAGGKTEQQYKDGLMAQIRKTMPKLAAVDSKKQGFLGEDFFLAADKAKLAKQKSDDAYGLGVSAAGRSAQAAGSKLGSQMRSAYGGMGQGMRASIGGQQNLTGVYGDKLKGLEQQRGYGDTQYGLSMDQANLAERKGLYGLEQEAEGDWESSMQTWLQGFKEGGRVPNKKETFLDVLSKIPEAGGS